MVNLQGLLLSNTEFEAQLCLLAFHAIVWFLWLQIAPRYVQSWISSKQWKDRLVTHSKHSFEKGFKIQMEYHDAFTSSCEMICIATQHIVGGILCTPSVLGFTGQTVWALARHGAMCEMGWELQDTFTRVYRVLYGGQSGKAQNPPAMLAFLGVHHVMGLSMIIPMNIYYGDCATYHQFVFLLQFAGAMAIASTQYGFTLDVKSENDLFQMKAVVTITWMALAWSRVIQFARVGSSLLGLLSSTQIMYYGGCTALAMMSAFNLAVFIDATEKLCKFVWMQHEGGDVINHAVDSRETVRSAENVRRNSVVFPKILAELKETVPIQGPSAIICAPIRSRIRRSSWTASKDRLI